MKKHYVFSLEDGSIRLKGGSKAKNLRFLAQNRFPVPPGWVVSWDAQSDYRNEPDAVLERLRQEITEKIHADKRYAVRSSASVEDDNAYSCAGLFCSLLQVQGIDAILAGILEVWKSPESEKFMAYGMSHSIDPSHVKMGVIIQEMVPAKCSGIVFSKNPLTGLSETIIEAGLGTGDEQVEARGNPERWVSKWGNWLEKPENGLISEDFAHDLVRKTAEIVRSYGKPVDLEWAHDGNSMYFLQVRPITQLDIPIYSNRITREMLPGIIKPLVWSVNTRLINKIWADILTRLTGDHSIRPEMLTGHYYYRAYFNMALFGRVFESLGMPYEALELLLGLELDGPQKPHIRPGFGVIPRVPSLLSFTAKFLSAEKQFRKMMETKRTAYEKMMEEMKPDLTSAQWLDIAMRIFVETEPVAYFNIMIPMQLMMYHRQLASLLQKQGVDIRTVRLSGLEDTAKHYSPHFHLEKLQQKYQLPGAQLTPEEEALLEADIRQLLDQFGHFSDSGNDCSSIPWRETPDLIRQMLDLPVQEKQEDSPVVAFDTLQLARKRNWMLQTLYRRTCRFAMHREAISSLYTFGYGQFRTCFVHMGEQFVEQGIIADKEDIFYLYWQEVVDLVHSKGLIPQKDLVEQRKQDIESYRDVMVPEMIFGVEQPPVVRECPNALRGIPTSLGTYTGPARILQGLSDFERLCIGDVLIIPFSDVGWTPLFARAGAVVAESGGILSHSSIVAREYRIPAVVSVAGACRIRDGAMVTVNGYTGDIMVGES
jgi:pyruvate,water dikinase